MAIFRGGRPGFPSSSQGPAASAAHPPACREAEATREGKSQEQVGCVWKGTGAQEEESGLLYVQEQEGGHGGDGGPGESWGDHKGVRPGQLPFQACCLCRSGRENGSRSRWGGGVSLPRELASHTTLLHGDSGSFVIPEI